MKTCSKCKQYFPLDMFAWRSRAEGTRQGQCDQCRKATAKASYERRRADVIKKTRERSAEYREESIAWKKKLHCVICDENYHKCLEFHHVDQSTKEGDLADILRKRSIRGALEEVKKCVVICANCHRKVHGGVIHITPHMIQMSEQQVIDSLC